MRYRKALLPGGTAWVDLCGDCGSMVLNRKEHDDWHDGEFDRIKQAMSKVLTAHNQSVYQEFLGNNG